VPPGAIVSRRPSSPPFIAPPWTEIEDRHPLRDRDSGRRDADPSARVYRVPRILDGHTQPEGVEPGDGLGYAAQHRMTRSDDGPHDHGALHDDGRIRLWPDAAHRPMAGHSKWANIQHRKKAQDAKRGKLFTKLIREVTIAAREGGGDPDANARLRLAMEKAFAGNVPKDTVDRAIKRATGEAGAGSLEEVRYEGYGPGGTAVMVDCVTDNRNRTVAELRYAFTKYGGNLGTGGSVAYLFSKVGQISFPPGTDEDRLMEAALEAGAEDVVANEDGSIEVITDPEEFAGVRAGIVAEGLEPEQAEVTMRPSTNVSLDAEHAQRIVRLLDMLDDLDDVQQVYSNAEISNEILAGLE